MNKSLRGLVTRARADRVSGSSVIVLTAAKGVVEVCRRSHDLPGREDFRQFAIALAHSQPNMASVWNLANSILLTDLKVESVADECSRLSTYHQNAPIEVGKRASKFLWRKTVVTNSSSRAVFEAIKAASNRSSIRVYVPESRPKREGVILANAIAGHGVDVVVVSDAALSRSVSKSDVAIAGADAINRKSIVGKVGLMNLALSAEEFGVDAIICADTSKFAPIPFVTENRPAHEILKGSKKKARAENVYFEEVPHRLFDNVLTESEQFKPLQIPRMVSSIRVARELAGFTSTS